MRPRIPLLLLACLPLLPMTLAAASSAESPAAAPHLQIANPDHDFGRITPGQRLDYQVQISNSGSAPLEIKDVRPSCGCTTADQWPHRLAPGASGTIPVQIDTSEFSGEVTRTLTVVSNDPAQPEGIVTFKVTAWLPLQVTPRVIILPATANPDEAFTRTAKVTNETAESVKVSDVTSDNPHFTAQLRELTPGKEFEVSVTTVPPLPEGTQLAKIQLHTSNAKMPEVTIQAVATILPLLQIAPAVVSLPAPKLRAPETRYVVLLSHRDTLEVSDVTTNAPGMTIASTATADRKQVTLTLKFPTGFEISPTAKLYVRGKTNQPTVPTFEIPIEDGSAD